MEFVIKNGVLGYGNNIILKNVNIIIETGQTLCVLGKNGAGKTTLFKSLLGGLPLLGGEIYLDGRDIMDWSRREYAAKVSYVPQARSLPFPYSCMDVVLFGRSAHIGLFGSPGKKDKKIACEAFEMMSISHLKDRIFTHLSGGEQQMVIVARALAQQPSFMIMDEPTSSLDFGNQVKLISRVNQLKSDSLGIIMATHSPDHAFMCDARVAVVDSQSISTVGRCEEIIKEPLLKKIYGVDVVVDTLGNGMHERKVCFPAI